MVIKFFHLVLKKYRKSFSKMCGSPGFKFSTFPAFVFFLVSLITLLVFQEKSRFIGNGSVSRFPEMHEAKIVFFGPEKAQKPCRQASTKPITGLWSRNLNFRLWVPLKASIVIGSRSGCNMQKFLAPALERFGRKNTENQCNICTTLNFQALAPVLVPLPKKFGSTIKNCLGSGSTALPTSSMLVAI